MWKRVHRRQRGCVIGVLCMMAATAAMGDLNWVTNSDEDNAILLTTTPVTPLFASTYTEENGAFLQLIWTPTGTNDPAVAWSVSPDGIDHGSSDNTVIDTSFFGFGTEGAGHFLNPTLQGLKQITQTAVGAFSTADYFFVRAWTEPSSSASYVMGDIPTASDAHYWDSQVYQWPAGEDPINTFTFNTHNIPPASPLEAYVASNVVVIPEPSTIALALMALGLLGRRLASSSRR